LEDLLEVLHKIVVRLDSCINWIVFAPLSDAVMEPRNTLESSAEIVGIR
jgi:hypothetical protein